MTLYNQGIGYFEYSQNNGGNQDDVIANREAAMKVLSEYDEDLLKLYNYKLKLLVIASPYCGDCKKAVPIIPELQQYFSEWEIKIVDRDNYKEIVEQFYTTSGRMKVPVFVFADQYGNEIARWVERPKISYIKIAELQAKRLKKEDYMAEYRKIPELKPPLVTKNIIDELLDVAGKSVALLRILPKRR